MLIHEVPEGEGKATLCCGTFPSLLRSGDLITQHPGIVTCDRRVLRCPSCNGEAGYLGMRTQWVSDFFSMGETILKVEPCMHEFEVRVGTDMKIRLNERNRDDRIHRADGGGASGPAEGGGAA